MPPPPPIYRIFRAARWSGIPVLTLLELPALWTETALMCERAEKWAEAEIIRKRRRRMGR